MTLASFLDDRAAEYGDRPALIEEGRVTTFRECADQAATLARSFARLGVGCGSRVGVLLPNGPEWLAAAFGALALGAQVVPINTLFTAEEREYVLRHADVSLLVTAGRFLHHSYVEDLVASCPGLSRGVGPLRELRLPALRRVVVLGEPCPPGALAYAELVAAGSFTGGEEWLRELRRLRVASDPAMIFFTSGTTASPKGAVHTHASIVRAAANVAECLGLDENDRTWAYLPFFFTGGFVAAALATLSRGGALLVQPVFDAAATLRLMSVHRCTTLFAWPHQAEALLAHPDFDAARVCLRKGVGANTAWAERLYSQRHSAVGTWGMTEAGPMATASRWDDPPTFRAAGHGRPQSGVELRLVDPATGRAVAEGEEGEVRIRGETLMSHYYRRARAECFDAEGYFATGDVGRFDADGQFHFVGRRKDVIKAAGVNVAAAEVEAVVMRCPGVAVAHAVGVPHPTRGEEVAVFVVRAEPSCTAAEIVSHCRRSLAAYKVPRWVFFCAEMELPLLGSGKIDKGALRRRALGPAPER